MLESAMRYQLHIDKRARLRGGLAVARWADEFGRELHTYEIPDGRTTLTAEEEEAGDLAAQARLERLG